MTFDMNNQGPKFIKFFSPLLQVLQEIGGTGRAAEVIDLVLEKMDISEKEQAETLNSGGSRVRNQIQWTRLYLVKAGYIDPSQRGLWVLTEKGQKTDPSTLDAYSTFKQAQALIQQQKKKAPAKDSTESVEEAEASDTPEENDYRTELLSTLQSLPPAGFERICQRLLREHGFLKVAVTGRSDDGGIDGHGILELNPFVSFTVLFQCKRYQGSVTASQVRDFRGALQGRADKGIIITTGSFTTEATKEGRRDGVPPIEMVDGEKLIEMFEKLELGLKPRLTYDVDQGFFEEFQS